MQLEIRGELVEVVPVREFTFPSEHEIGDMFYLTCRNHPTARYSTKNPYCRSLHFLEGPEGSPFKECPCSFDELVVIVGKAIAIGYRCEKCGSSTHRDDAMESRCDGCEYLVRQCICTPSEA